MSVWRKVCTRDQRAATWTLRVNAAIKCTKNAKLHATRAREFFTLRRYLLRANGGGDRDEGGSERTVRYTFEYLFIWIQTEHLMFIVFVIVLSRKTLSTYQTRRARAR